MYASYHMVHAWNLKVYHMYMCTDDGQPLVSKHKKTISNVYFCVTIFSVYIRTLSNIHDILHTCTCTWHTTCMHIYILCMMCTVAMSCTVCVNCILTLTLIHVTYCTCNIQLHIFYNIHHVCEVMYIHTHTCHVCTTTLKVSI